MADVCKIVSWDEAEVAYPGCSTYWDVKFSQNPSYADGPPDVTLRRRGTVLFAYASGQRRWYWSQWARNWVEDFEEPSIEAESKVIESLEELKSEAIDRRMKDTMRQAIASVPLSPEELAEEEEMRRYREGARLVRNIEARERANRDSNE